MSAGTIATIIVILFIAAAAVYGYARGFLKILITTIALVVTLVLAFLIAPHFAKLLEGTSIGANAGNQQLKKISIDVVAFLIIAILIYVAIRIVLGVAHVISRIPIVRGFNRILGAIIGILEALLVIWIVCLIIQSISFTPFGIKAVAVINQSEVLKFFYDHNFLTIIATKAFQK